MGEGDDCTDSVHGLVSDGQSISSSSVKTANNKMPVSSVFNDSEGLCRTTVCRCLVCRPHYPAQQMRFGSRVRASFFFSDTPPRLRGKTTYRDQAQQCLPQRQRKIGNYCLPATCFTNSDISACCFTSTSRARPPENLKYLSPARTQTFAMEKISSPRERRKWSLEPIRPLP